MEAVIEYGDLRNIRAENIDTGADSLEMGGVVKGSKINKALDSLYDLIVYKNRFVEQSAALYYAVSYCGYFAHRVYNGTFALGKIFLDLFKGDLMIGQINFVFIASAVGSFSADYSAGSYSFCNSFCYDAFIGHIKKLIFEG